MLDQGLAVDDLGVVVERPAEEGEEVEDGVGQVALVAVFEGGVGAVPFGELGAVGPEDRRHVNELRRLPAEGPEDEDVPGQAGDPLFASEDVRDLHQVIVHHGRQVVGGVAVRLQDHEVVERGVLEDDLAADLVAGHGLAG